MTNRLASESSPYLRQHADNPVDWYPWGEEALARARATDRPILLSIGYSSCHWCHVMERESFEDPDTATLMNELFVNVKVDREERPDLDQVYMKAVQAMTGGGGWPLTAWLTPDGVPFYGGTYFPPRSRPGMPAFREVLRATAEAWHHRRAEVLEAGRGLVEAIRRATEPPDAGAEGSGEGDPRREALAGTRLLDAAYASLDRAFDETHGGFGSAPKFPQPVTLEIVLRRWERTGEERAGRIALHTLERMAAGGLRDHLAGGFHRYSVDARWRVPHFEKMLYDNALLARAFLDAYRASGEPAMRAVATETLDWLLADMRAPEGGFYTALDADSEGEEGRYYVWTPAEVEDALGAERARVFGAVYGVREAGDLDGKSVLHLAEPIAEVAAREGLSEEALAGRLAEDRRRLLEVRRGRVAPFRDEKILTGWNAMTLRALAEAGAALERPDWVRAAADGARFLLEALRPDGRLLRVYMDGTARIDAFLEDHAALGNALLSIHAATLDPTWLDPARRCCEEVLERFRDEASGAFFDVPTDGETLVLRPRDPLDNATPSGPSLAAELLVRAAHLFDEERYRRAAEDAFLVEASAMARYGSAYGRMLSALDRARATPVEVALAGDPEDGGPAGETARALLAAAHAPFARNLTIAGRRPGDEAPADVPLLEGRDAADGRPTAWVCSGYACRLPVHDAPGLTAELERVRASGVAPDG